MNALVAAHAAGGLSPGQQLWMEVAGTRYPVDSLAEASLMHFTARKEAERRGQVGLIPDVRILRHDGSTVGYIGPGDVVFEHNDFRPVVTNKRLYDPVANGDYLHCGTGNGSASSADQHRKDAV